MTGITLNDLKTISKTLSALERQRKKREGGDLGSDNLTPLNKELRRIAKAKKWKFRDLSHEKFLRELIDKVEEEMRLEFINKEALVNLICSDQFTRFKTKLGQTIKSYQLEVRDPETPLLSDDKDEFTQTCLNLISRSHQLVASRDNKL